MPFFDSVRDHLLAEQHAGTLEDADLVTTHDDPAVAAELVLVLDAAAGDADPDPLGVQVAAAAAVVVALDTS